MGQVIKRFLDIIISFVGIIILLPILIIVSVLVRLNLGSPILFKQERVGKNNKIFQIIKFRSMNSKVDEMGKLLSDNQRLTKLGRFLRKTSIDELPQLINVIKGDMSLIGPRALLTEYLSLYNDTQRKRHKVLPGITGLAQVSGRNLLSWKEKFELDVYYVENWSIYLDIKIFLKTFIKVFKREGIDNSENKMAEYFNGKN